MRNPQKESDANDSEDEDPITRKGGNMFIRRELHHVIYELRDFGNRVGKKPMNQPNAEKNHQCREDDAKNRVGYLD
ncbi:hypothetical protein OG520_26550 [Streptomyces sp. NBC_00984]|uniref:hypothetical protein n=1 Tax=Streptomyces sp. NBC_00984 TaxID=2903700 RepID=UPI00386D1EE3|nr:hypothetical protein OG520_26550 [Streptomyces sp. NBC_00984]